MEFKKPRQILPQEISKIISREIKVQKIKVLRASKLMLKQIAEISEAIKKNTLPCYLVCKKLPHNLGSGIFLHPQANPIEKGSIIAPYSGIVSIESQNDSDEGSDYVFAPLSDMHLTKKEQELFDKKHQYHPKRLYSLQLDALKEGNFTRFINHSSTPNIVAELVSIKANSLGLSPSPLEVVYMAKKIIKPGEQLLICYEGDDKSYWGAAKIKPFPMTPKTFQLDENLNIKNKTKS